MAYSAPRDGLFVDLPSRARARARTTRYRFSQLSQWERREVEVREAGVPIAFLSGSSPDKDIRYKSSIVYVVQDSCLARMKSLTLKP